MPLVDLERPFHMMSELRDKLDHRTWPDVPVWPAAWFHNHRQVSLRSIFCVHPLDIELIPELSKIASWVICGLSLRHQAYTHEIISYGNQ